MRANKVNYRRERAMKTGMSVGMSWGLAAFEALKRHRISEQDWTAWVLSEDGSDDFDAKVVRFAPATVTVN